MDDTKTAEIVFATDDDDDDDDDEFQEQEWNTVTQFLCGVRYAWYYSIRAFTCILMYGIGIMFNPRYDMVCVYQRFILI